MRTAVQITRHASRLAAGLLLAAGTPASGVAQNPAAPPRTPDVIFVPTPLEVVEQMLALARVTKNDVVYDLGCGDGRIVIAAARRYGARGVGIDIDPRLIAESRRNAAAAGVADRVRFYERDLFETDLRQASVVMLYLAPSLNLKLRPKLFAELRPGARVVSHNFDMGGWEADSLVQLSETERGAARVYLWVLPADVAGTWDVAAVGGGIESRYALRLGQQYQRITGAAVANGRTLPLADARLAGDSIAFAVTDTTDGRPVTLRFSGRVSGDTMSGTVTVGRTAARRAWRATRVRSGGSGRPGHAARRYLQPTS